MSKLSLASLKAGAALALCLCLAGCAAAIAAAPVAMGSMGGATAIATEGNGVDESEAAERCDQLARALPDIFQARMSGDGALELRRLAVAKVRGQRRWVALSARGADAQGWSRGSPLASADFSPPLTPALDGGGSNFLVSVPLAENDPLDSRQMMSFTALFAPATGTYKFNGRTYQYAVTQSLPCFGKAY